MTEEESTGDGALSTLLRGYRADAALIPEPTGGTINRVHTGTLWFRLQGARRARARRLCQTGTNAILAAYRLIQALQRHRAERNECGDSASLVRGHHIR